MATQWTAARLVAMARAYQPACLLAAAAELDLFGVLGASRQTVDDLANRIGVDRRALEVLADALVALGLLVKEDQWYAAANGVVGLLAGCEGVTSIIRHQAQCLRGWARLADVVRSGSPAQSEIGPITAQDSLATFVSAMDRAASQVAPDVVDQLGPLRFRHMLDVGGGAGTWTIAFLKAIEGGTATLFDRPQVIGLAREQIARAGLTDRVCFEQGDFLGDDPLPEGADMAWISAVAHTLPRDENRRLFGKVSRALSDSGFLLLRDIIMDEDRTQPVAGAFFSVNMLVHTVGGRTYTLPELSVDLREAGFGRPRVVCRDGLCYTTLCADKSLHCAE